MHLRHSLRSRFPRILGGIGLTLALLGCAAPTATQAPLPSAVPSASPVSPTLTAAPSPTSNPTSTANLISTAQVSTPAVTSEPLSPDAYCLWPGDTLTWVANQAGVRLADLQGANPKANGFAGSTLHLPSGSVPPERWKAALPVVKSIDDLPFSDSGIYLGFNNRKKQVSLTFDIGYEPQNATMMEWLAGQGIHATFFVVGESVDKHPDLIQAILANGHSLGNHSWNHPNLQGMGENDVISQLQRTEKAVNAAQPGATTKPLFRAPFGAINGTVINVARYAGYHIIGWTVDSHDWMNDIDGETVYQRVTQNVCPGAIVEMHDANPANTSALPRIVAFLKRNGYEMVDLKSLLFP